MSDEQEALKLADALDLKISAYPPHYTDVDAAAAMLRKLVAEREADRAAMREIALVAHCGGLGNLNEWQALTMLRRLTLSYFDKSLSNADVARELTDLRQRLEGTT